jgi:mono/diheme cytochrome c family protein
VNRGAAPTLVALALALVAGLAGARPVESWAQSATLTVSDRSSSKTYTRQELLGRSDARDVTVADPSYGRPMTYRVVPAAGLLRELKVAPDDYVQARATDNFSISVPARLMTDANSTEPEALVAIESPQAPWPPLPHATTSAGPFYLVWQLKPGTRVASEYWSYHLAALTVTDGPLQRWPALRVGAEVPANDPIRIGLERYLEVCIACHRFKGAGEGDQGPDLGEPMNPVQYFQIPALKQLVRNPASVRHWPEMKMPGFDSSRLSDSDLDALVAWLAYKAKQR